MVSIPILLADYIQITNRLWEQLAPNSTKDSFRLDAVGKVKEGAIYRILSFKPSDGRRWNDL